MDLATARSAVATALSAVGTFKVGSRPPNYPKPGDGWVVISRLQPSSFTASTVTFTAVILLSADLEQAETLYETYGVALVNAAAALPAGGVALEAISLAVGTANAEFHALTITMTVEVS